MSFHWSLGNVGRKFDCGRGCWIAEILEGDVVGENSKIEWCDHTFNPWTGCTKVSPACTHCYAEAWAKRTGIVKWGDSAERRRTSESYWKQPLKWNREAA